MKIHSLSRLTNSKTYRFVILIVFVSALFLTGCGGQGQSDMDLMADMPSEIQNAPSVVRESYQFALTNPEALKNVPCYCGCDAVGHTSNYSCYVKGINDAGEIIFDQHALGCSICVDISQDVIRLTNDGKSPTEIRSIIDDTYAQFGPSNMAPVQ